MLEKYTEITGAFRRPKYREVLESNISDTEGSAKNSLNTAIVTVSTGKKFYVDPTSRADIADAIAISTENGLTETTWKLAEEIDGSKWATVTLAELQEARYLGLSYKGELIG